MRKLVLLLSLLANTAHAQSLGQPLACGGTNPDWTLTATETGARFDFQRVSELQQMLETQAEGADWPRALTFIGRGDSAIVILEDRVCETEAASGPYTARILTQRGETPILLTGCCEMPQG